MKMPTIFENNGVKGVGGVAALEGLNTVTSNFHSLYNAEIGDLIGSVAGAVDSGLEMTGINSAIASNPLFETIASGASGLGAMALSNNVLKDFGLVSEGNTFGLKNMARYAINTTAATSAFAVGSAAIPYIIGGGAVYWVGKHGWKWGKEGFKRSIGTAWGLTGGAVKGAVKGAKNGAKGEQRINPNIS